MDKLLQSQDKYAIILRQFARWVFTDRCAEDIGVVRELSPAEDNLTNLRRTTQWE